MASSLPESKSSDRDWILLNNLALRASVGSSLWVKPDAHIKLQPVLISLAVPFSISLAGSSDHLSHSIHYGVLAKTVEKTCTKSSFTSMEHMAETIAASALAAFPTMEGLAVAVEKPRALLHAKSASVRLVRHRSQSLPELDQISVNNLELATIIGIHPWEHEAKQLVRINLTLDVGRGSSPDGFNYVNVVDRVSEHVLASTYQTMEALVTAIAHQSILSSPLVKRVTARVAKPSALMFAESPEIQVTRMAEDFVDGQADRSHSGEGKDHIAAIAFGSNIGDRFQNIQRALQGLTANGAAKIIDTSFLYESKAMYVEDQRNFVNGACLISTTLSPPDLLDVLKTVEVDIGRTKTFTNGPRVVDLDLIFYDEQVYQSSDEVQPERRLVIPHERMHEREFVLRPLADMIPGFVHPVLGLSIRSLLQRLSSTSPPLRKVIPFPKRDSQPEPDECRYWTWGLRTQLMAAINTTPDSFSDGGDHASVDNVMPFVSTFALPSGSSMVDMIDIGGYSTRPGAVPITPEEEIGRTVPVIKAIRATGNDTLISIDTFRASVAQAALKAGADVVNDVYGLTRDPDILEAVRDAGCPVIMMHSRGDPGQDKDYSSDGGVMQGVKRELGEKVQRALDAGVRRWNLIVDPGVGFSKTVEGNVILVRRLADLTAVAETPLRRSLRSCVGSVGALEGMPVLVGASRKSFLGRLVEARGEVSPKERGTATIAVHTAAVQQGADIVRVHDVKEGWDMIQVADAIWR